MAKRTVKTSGKGTEVNAEGNEKSDNTSTTSGELTTSTLTDDNFKVAGLSNGKRMATIASTANGNQ